MAAKRFGKWVEIEKLTDHTGQAMTHLVYEDGDDAQVKRVLKRMKSDGPFKNRLQRFRAEIDACTRLMHPNIIRLVDSGLSSDKPYLVTEYCSRGSLNAKFLAGMTLVERLNVFKGICKGIAHAHAKHVVHRDLKPDNIFLHADGTPVVGDFGLCFFLDGTQDRATHLNEAVGARWFMAQECEGGRTQTVGPAADVYSLGKVLYWMLAGRIFSREQHTRRPYDLRPHQPHQATSDMHLVYTLFDRMILEEPTTRFKDGAEVLREVDVVINRILSRRRIFDLANTAPCRVSHSEVRVASFRPGSTVIYDDVDVSGFEPGGFGGSGHGLALWGINSSGHPNELAIFTPFVGGSWTRSVYTSTDNAAILQASRHQSPAFDGRGQASVAVIESRGEDRKLLVTTGGESNITTTVISEDIGNKPYKKL